VVDIEYTDNGRCYKVVYNSWQRRQRIEPPSNRSEPFARPADSYTYGMISRWYAVQSQMARARWSALAASASESKMPVKMT
jgi:hypothetical protein